MEIKFENLGTLSMSNGLPSDYSAYQIENANSYHLSARWGTVCLQQLHTGIVILDYYLFSLKEAISFYCTNYKKRLQCLLSLHGHYQHYVKTGKAITLLEKEFILFDSKTEESLLTVYPSAFSSIINTHFGERGYKDYLDIFPDFKKELGDSKKRVTYFTLSSKIAGFSIYDSIASIWLEKYVPQLVDKHIELQLENSLFKMLAQTYSPIIYEPVTALEREKSAEAKDYILKDITKHYTPEQISIELLCSAPWLKKAFSKVYGMGMFQFLRATRMTLAKQMLLDGESLKAVALTVGMKPRNFPKEFKTYFGYTVTALKKGLAK